MKMGLLCVWFKKHHHHPFTKLRFSLVSLVALEALGPRSHSCMHHSVKKKHRHRLCSAIFPRCASTAYPSLVLLVSHEQPRLPISHHRRATSRHHARSQLTFSFSLPHYTGPNDQSEKEKKKMRAVILLVAAFVLVTVGEVSLE